MVKQLTLEEFNELVFDISQPDCMLKSDKPVIIDLYATYCSPCKMLAPVLDELAVEYGDKLTIYKVDTEEQPEICKYFKIRSVPTVVYIPVHGKYTQKVGSQPKAIIKQYIKDMLNIE